MNSCSPGRHLLSSCSSRMKWSGIQQLSPPWLKMNSQQAIVSHFKKEHREGVCGEGGRVSGGILAGTGGQPPDHRKRGAESAQVSPRRDNEAHHSVSPFPSLSEAKLQFGFTSPLYSSRSYTASTPTAMSPWRLWCLLSSQDLYLQFTFPASGFPHHMPQGHVSWVR